MKRRSEGFLSADFLSVFCILVNSNNRGMKCQCNITHTVSKLGKLLKIFGIVPLSLLQCKTLLNMVNDYYLPQTGNINYRPTKLVKLLNESGIVPVNLLWPNPLVKVVSNRFTKSGCCKMNYKALKFRKVEIESGMVPLNSLFSNPLSRIILINECSLLARKIISHCI